MKKILPAAMLLCALALPAQAQNKIGTIDMSKVFDKYWKLEPAKVSLKEQEDQLSKEMKTFMEDYKKENADYDKLVAIAQDRIKSDEERSKARSAAEAKSLELRETENSIRTFRENANTKLDTQKKRIRENLVQDIQTAVEAKAKAGGLSMVVDTASIGLNGTSVILYSNGENDITEAIIAQLNAGAPTDASKVSEKK